MNVPVIRVPPCVRVATDSMACSILCTLLAVVTAAVIGTVRGDGDPLTAGFTPRPYDVPLHARYEFAAGVRRMWVYSTDKPISATHHGAARTETKIDEVYRSGVWQFEGEVYVPAGTSGACIMQIFGAAPERQATTLMLHVYDGRLTFYHDLRRVLADGVYDRWLRLNVVHDVGARNVTVFVDGAEVLRSRSHGAPGAAHYFKFGVYKQPHGVTMEERSSLHKAMNHAMGTQFDDFVGSNSIHLQLSNVAF